MDRMAQLAFDHIWLMLFGSDDQIDPDYAVKLQEELALILPELTSDEQDALAKVARDVKAQLLAQPDDRGYSQRRLVTEPQRQFLDAVIENDIFRGFTAT